MRGILLFLILQSPAVFAQNYYPVQKTQLNKFVEAESIEWAIYKNDSLITDKPDLRTLLINKAKAKKIKVFYSIEEGKNTENDIQYFTKKDYSLIEFDRSLQEPYSNEAGDLAMPPYKKRKLDLTDPRGEIWVSQILFVKNGLLSSTINRVSPRLNVVSAGGIYFGKAEIFSTALNKDHTNDFSKKHKIIFLKKTNTEFYVDSIKRDNKLKEMYGHNLIETLWPYMSSQKIKCYTIPENKKITIKEIQDKNLLNLATINIPIYDSIGNFSANKLVTAEINANMFDKISITQEWFYNETKKIVICKIPFALISVKQSYNADPADKTLHQIKLVF